MAARRGRLAEAKLIDLVKRRRDLDRQIGVALSEVAAAAGPTLARPPIHVNAGAHVAVRIAKQGLVYVFSLNLGTLPHSDQHFYPLLLQIGTNGLVWTLIGTKPAWAYQVDLIVDGQVMVLDRQSGPGSVPPPQQQAIVVS